MKRITVLLILAGILLTFPACGGGTPAEPSPEPGSPSSVSLSETEARLSGLAGRLDQVEFQSIVTDLTQEQKEELLELLRLETWESREPLEHGVNLRCFFLGYGVQMAFFDGGALVTDGESGTPEHYSLPAEGVEALTGFALNLTEEGIRQGNERLLERLYAFDGLLVDEPDNLYEIPPENIYRLKGEELQELHGLFHVDQWRLYTGDYSAIHSDEGVPFTLEKAFPDGHMLLQIKQYGDLYIAKSRSYAGPTGEDVSFVIPGEVYQGLLAFQAALK